jgi:hypothetical protein
MNFRLDNNTLIIEMVRFGVFSDVSEGFRDT